MKIDKEKYKNFNIKDSDLKVLGKEHYVVGQEVDEKNHLWYVINTGDDLIIEDAQKVHVTRIKSNPSFIKKDIKQYLNIS